MSKLIIVLVFLASLFNANCQSLIVKSFRWTNPDYKISVPASPTELKGNKYAIIKVETSQQGLTYDFDKSIKELAVLHLPAETWLWIPSGVTQVNISNSVTGEKLTYPFGKPLGKTEFYIMVLNLDQMNPPGNNKRVEAKWFSIFTTPLGANITIDSLPAGRTPFTGSLTIGNHNLTLDYYGEVKKQVLNVNDHMDPVIYMTFVGDGKPVIPVGYVNYNGEIKPKSDANDYFATDEAAQFPGGTKKLAKFLSAKISYPIRALQNGIRGVVFVQFKVDEQGLISDIKILRGLSGDCDEEALRVVKLMPRWKPATFEGKPTKSLFTLPIRFNISTSSGKIFN